MHERITDETVIAASAVALAFELPPRQKKFTYAYGNVNNYYIIETTIVTGGEEIILLWNKISKDDFV
jgi:hypothetical protein